jgi:hypothetical protein
MEHPALSWRRPYDEAQLGVADDIHDADGKTVLDFWQAVASAREHAGIEPERTGPYTVEDAVDDYVEFKQTRFDQDQTVAQSR